MKWITRVALGLAIAVAVAAIGYFGYQKYQRSQQAEVACVATLFPYFLIEHNQNSIVSALRDMQKEGSGAAAERPPFMSKAIDQRLSEIAERLRQDDEATADGKDAKNPATNLAQDFENLVSLFRADAPTYLNECVNLFNEIYNHCGELGSQDEAAQNCFQGYQNDIQDLVSHYTNAPPAKR